MKQPLIGFLFGVACVVSVVALANPLSHTTKDTRTNSPAQPDTVRWEYLVVTKQAEPPTEWLNAKGQLGWELIAFEGYDANKRYVFKRHKVE